jgi:hypothetical protein
LDAGLTTLLFFKNIVTKSKNGLIHDGIDKSGRIM